MTSNDEYQHQNSYKPSPKVLGFMTIHYAGDYLKESLLSVREYVHKMVISYTASPSHGYSSSIPCPDTKEYIYNICKEVLGNKMIWDEADHYAIEGEHRAVKYKYSEGYDLILTVDSDEVMINVQEALDKVHRGNFRYAKIAGYVNFFRSHYWAAYDGFRPVRIEALHADNQIQEEVEMTVYHFSCAQRREIMEYKYQVFGHASEIKPNYLRDIFYKWSPDNNIPDLHPVSYNLWNAVPFNAEVLPWYLKEHKNHNKSYITG